MTFRLYSMLVFNIALLTILNFHQGWAYDEITFKAQACLKDKGYDPGPIDGVFGKRTEDAVVQYQRDNDLLISGRLSEDLIGLICDGVDISKYRTQEKSKKVASAKDFQRKLRNDHTSILVKMWRTHAPSEPSGVTTYVRGASGEWIARSAAGGENIAGKLTVIETKAQTLRVGSPAVYDASGRELPLATMFNNKTYQFDIHIPEKYTRKKLKFSMEGGGKMLFPPFNFTVESLPRR